MKPNVNGFPQENPNSRYLEAKMSETKGRYDSGEVALDPCPFCGSAEAVKGNTEANIGYCTKCFDTYDPFVYVWNTRPIEDALRAENTRLTAELAAAREALRALYEACMAADADGELDYRIDGDILDAARLALPNPPGGKNE